MKPRAADICCGLGGWTAGLQAEGYDVTGYDIEEHVYGEERYPGRLVIRDVLAMHGSEVAWADLIVASPPCQKYSYMAMPWSLAKAKAAAIRADDTGQMLAELNAIFNACFRIQREASEAAGRHIPMVLENVKGAQPWVGKARWNFGSYYLWGDVPALMPQTGAARKFNPDGSAHPHGSWFAIADSKNRGALSEGRKNPGFRFDGSGRSFQSESVERHVAEGRKNDHGGSWFKIGSPGQKVTGQNPDGRLWTRDVVASCGSKSPKRKAASAKIAKIPMPLAQWIARAWLPAKTQAA